MPSSAARLDQAFRRNVLGVSSDGPFGDRRENLFSDLEENAVVREGAGRAPHGDVAGAAPVLVVEGHGQRPGQGTLFDWSAGSAAPEIDLDLHGVIRGEHRGPSE